MHPVYNKAAVCENTEICEGIYNLSIRVESMPLPGQFFMLRAWGIEPVLSRPISVHDFKENTVSFLYEVKGRGTRIFGSLCAGDTIEYMGPLGRGFDIDHIGGKVAIVTGGIGIAPMYYAAEMLKNVSIDLYSGFRSRLYLIGDMEHLSDNIYIATEDGSEGYKGFITDIFSPMDYCAVLCCGPRPMMDKVIRSCIRCATPVLVSMESRMACGIGACLGCSCRTISGNKRTCKEGPVFSGREVILHA